MEIIKAFDSFEPACVELAFDIVLSTDFGARLDPQRTSAADEEYSQYHPFFVLPMASENPVGREL